MPLVRPTRIRGQPKDMGWAWVVLLVSFLSQLILGAVYYSAGVINVYLLEAFGQSKSYTSIPTSTMCAIYQVSVIFASALVNRFGARVTMIGGAVLASGGLVASAFTTNVGFLILSFGILVGTGLSPSYLVTFTGCSQWFSRYKVLALTLVAAGPSIGILLMPFFCNYVTHLYSWRGFFIIMGAATLQLCVLGALIRENVTESETIVPEDTKMMPNQMGSNLSLAGVPTSSTEERKTIYWGIIRKPAFICHLSSTILQGTANALIYIHIIAYMRTQGLSEVEANNLMIVIGAGNATMRVVIAFTANALPGNVVLLSAGTLGISALATLFCPIMVQTRIGIYFYVAIFGFYGGGFMALWAVVCDEVVEDEELGSAIGMGCFWYGLGTLVGPPMAGAIFDATNKYAASFYLAGTLLMLSTFSQMMSVVWTGRDTATEAPSTTDINNCDNPKETLKRKWATNIQNGPSGSVYDQTHSPSIENNGKLGTVTGHNGDVESIQNIKSPRSYVDQDVLGSSVFKEQAQTGDPKANVV